MCINLLLESPENNTIYLLKLGLSTTPPTNQTVDEPSLPLDHPGSGFVPRKVDDKLLMGVDPIRTAFRFGSSVEEPSKK